MPNVIYAVLIFAVLGFGISYVMINGAKNAIISENENLKKDAEFNKRIKLFKKLNEASLVYGAFIFLFARMRFLNGDIDFVVLNTACIVFIILNFVSSVSEGISVSDAIKNGKLTEENYSKVLLRFMFEDLGAIVGIVYFFLKVQGII